MNVAQLERDLDAKRTEGLALVASTSKKCKEENDRLMTDAERGAITAISDAGMQIKAQLDKAKGDDEVFARIDQLTAGYTSGTAPRVTVDRRSMGEQFVASNEYKGFFLKGAHRTQSAWRSPSIELFDPRGMRAATLTEDPASGGALVVPQYVPGIIAPPPRLVVGDLFAPGTADSNVINYMREKTYTNAAAAVAEGQPKPESTLIFEAASDPVRKIAHWLPVSEEMLEDVAQIRSYIDARLRQGVLMEEEDQLLHGTGVAPNLEGLLERDGLAPEVTRVDPMENADAILAQIMAIFGSSWLMPDGVVMNPSNWASTLLAKNSQGGYFTAGPFAPIQQATLWGLPVAITPAITAGKAAVGAFRTAAQVFRKGGIRVEASNSHQDYFIKNLVAIRAEERLALAVYRPGAFGEVIDLKPVQTVP